MSTIILLVLFGLYLVHRFNDNGPSGGSGSWQDNVNYSPGDRMPGSINLYPGK